MSMRQTMALADEGWASPRLLQHLFRKRDGFRRIGSLALSVAFFLNALGVVLPPLQEVLLGQIIIRAPVEVLAVVALNDLVYLVGHNPIKPSNANGVLALQGQLEVLSESDLQPRLWTYQTPDQCRKRPIESGDLLNHDTICGNTASLGYIRYASTPKPYRDGALGGPPEPVDTNLTKSFASQLPDGFNTGLFQQFAPRVNSTTQCDTISASDFPNHCKDIEGALFERYVSPIGDWNVSICMPDDQRMTPWKPTRARHDFEERLYLQINDFFLKITMHTTSGYFELPNYLNGESASNVLDEDPNELCGPACPGQGGALLSEGGEVLPAIENEYFRKVKYGDFFRSHAHKYIEPYPPLSNVTSLALVRNKGPLLSTALALFGRQSWIATRYRNPMAYDAQTKKEDEYCIGYPPLGLLSEASCVTSSLNATEQVSQFLNLFQARSEEERVFLAVTFNQAAFLSNQLFLTSDDEAPTFSVLYDLGKELQVAVLSHTAIMVVSALLGVQLFCLHALTLYASFRRTWTKSLDAFTMMRLGAAMGPEKLPLAITRDVWSVPALNDCPGWVGDSALPGDFTEGQTRSLALGSTRKVIPREKYVSFRHTWEDDPDRGLRGLWRRVKDELK